MNCLNCGAVLEGSETTCPCCNINVKSFGTFKQEAINPIFPKVASADLQPKNTCPNCREDIDSIHSDRCPSCNFKLDIDANQTEHIFRKLSTEKRKGSNNHIKYFGIN